MSPADFEATITACLPSQVEIASCTHWPGKGMFDVTLKWGGSRTRFALTDEATEPMIRIAVAQIVDGLRPAEPPRRKVGGR